MSARRQSTTAADGRRRLAYGIAGLLVVFLAFRIFVPVVSFSDPLGIAVLDREGRLLDAVTAADGQWRFGPPAAVPDTYRAALLAFEDHRFPWHPGVDPLAIARAMRQNLAAGAVVSGGSTITMQVVRLARHGRPRTLREKAIECLLALRLELGRSKDEILGLYAGYAPFGGNTVGLQAAAWRYFRRDPKDLSWAEAATLAVLPNAPSLIHPGKRQERLLERRNALLERLHAEGVIDDLTLRLAAEEPLPGPPAAMPHRTPHLVDRLRRVRPEGGLIRTTLDAALQEQVAAVAGRHHRRLADNHIAHLGILVTDTNTGRILAHIGNVGRAGDPGAQVDVTVARRSSGSILKPFLFAAMLANGEILPDELVPDIPTRIGGFAPRNFDNRFSGAVPASTALSRSLNVPAVRMLRSHGIGRFAATLETLGLTTLFRPPDDYGLSLILGGAEVTLWEMTAAYAGLGRTVTAYLEGQPADLKTLTWQAGAGRSLGPSPFDAAVAYQTLEALQEVARPGLDASWRQFASSRKVAWKTGTSYGFRDAWAIGVTPAITVGVWAGNASGEGRPGLTGHAAAAPVLFELFEGLPAQDFFDRPGGLMHEVSICRDSGLRAGPDCRATAALVPGAALPGRVCPNCRRIHLDPDRPVRVDASCQPVDAMRAVSWFVLPPALAHGYSRRHPEYRPLPPWRPDCRSPSADPRISILYPDPGAEIYVPLELDGTRGRFIAEAAHADPRGTVFWHLDGAFLGRTRGTHTMALAPEPGPHVLTLIDEDGQDLSRRFTILER